jgi:hypothetical protein
MNRISVFQKRAIPIWAADALALLGLLVYFIQSVSFAYNTVSNLDEGSYLLKGYLFAAGEYRPFEPGISTGKAPLSFLIPGYVQLIFGPGLRTGRCLAIFFGVMAVIGLWAASRRVGGKWLAAAAVWVLASSPVVIKFYSGGATQSTIACLLAWTLFLSLGEDRSFWRLTLAGFLAGLLMLVRQNMMPALPLLILYAVWQHGWKKSWGLAVSGISIVALVFYIYWPDILQLWTWIPLIRFPADATYSGGGVPVRWLPDIPLSARLLSIFQAFRFHFIPLVGSAITLLLLPKIKNWRSRADLGMAVFLALLFWGLLYMHFEAAIGLDYCVFCFSPYIAFFNVAGILFVVVAIQSWESQPCAWRQALLVILFIIITVGMAFSAFETLGRALLDLPAPRIRGFTLLPGFVTWRQLLSNGLQLNYNSAMKVASTVFGFIVGVTLVSSGYVIWRRAWRNSLAFGAFFAAMILLAGIVFSPLLHGRVNDCETDVIAANEEVGAYLNNIIPPGSLVYWDGGLSAAPLLYLPEVKIFPPQINAGYTYFSGGETSQVIKFGYWNEELNAQWKAAADFFVVEDERYARKWIGFFSPDQFDEFPRSARTSCLPESRLRIFRRK